MGLPGAFSLQYIPAAFIVHGDAAATARKITEAPFLYRVGILSDLVSAIFFLILAANLYYLLKDVDLKNARLMVIFVLSAVAIGFVCTVALSAPLIFLSGADFLSVFTRPQLEALAYGSLRLRGSGLDVAAAFWGLWLLPFGILVFKSGFIPRLLGVCLIVGGFAYLTFSLTAIIFPASRHTVSLITLPFYAIGELPIAFWFLVKGVRVPQPEARLS
jgi:hypothetical protein